jgi:hypothetical protein
MGAISTEGAPSLSSLQGWEFVTRYSEGFIPYCGFTPESPGERFPITSPETIISTRRVAHALDLPGINNAMGAPSFAHFAKGGYHERLKLRSPNAASGETTPRALETNSRSSLHSLALARLPPEDRNDNCSSAIVPAIPPVLVSPDCGACTSTSPHASSSSTR